MRQASIIICFISVFILSFAQKANAQEIEELSGTVGPYKADLALTQLSETEWGASVIFKDYEKEFYGLVAEHTDENHGFTDLVTLSALDGSDDYMRISYTTIAWMGVIETTVVGTLSANGKKLKMKFENVTEIR